MTKKIKIYGERNTCTNYLTKLIELNLKAEQLLGIVPLNIRKLQNRMPGTELIRDLYFKFSFKQNLGWKHSSAVPLDKLKKYPIVSDELVFITLTKNPYAWLLSLYKNPYNRKILKKPDFGDFLLQPWVTVGRDKLNVKVNNPIELWNIKNRSYLGLQSTNTINTTSEAIQNNPEGFIDLLSNKFAIEKHSSDFVDFAASTKDKNKDRLFYKDYYVNEKWQDSLSKEHIHTINQHLDHELMAFFDYKVL
jgi:hypothetical protein